MAPGVVYALDFDGVICDSVGESSVSGIAAAAALWDDAPLQHAAAEARASGGPAWLVRALRKARPVVETGYEVVVMARALCAAGEAGADALADDFVRRWPQLRDEYCSEWGADQDTLIETFGKIRDAWIERDIESWLGANRFYPGVADALNFAAADVYVITTKQKRFCELLLQRYGVHKVPSERIFGYGSGTKISVLKKIVGMPESKGRSVVFVEDRYATLEETSLSMLGQPLELFLATWGYNTEKTREEASRHPFINLIDLQSFVTKFQ